MRTIFIALFFTTTALAGYTNAFRPFQVLSYRDKPPQIDSSKAASVTNGMTLGQVVTNLGPGWIYWDVNIVIIRWSFTDGQELNILPSSYSASVVIHSDIHSDSRFWFTTNANIVPSK